MRNSGWVVVWVCMWKSWIVQVCEIEEKRKKEKKCMRASAQLCERAVPSQERGPEEREKETAREREGGQRGSIGEEFDDAFLLA